jgi:hypothetical protein
LGLNSPGWVAQIALGLLFWFKETGSMNWSSMYDEDDYDYTIVVIRLHHMERQGEITHEKKLDEVWN